MSKVVVITGANSGIGLAAAKLYESNGYFVVLGCRDEKKGLSTEKEIGKRSKFLKIDMTDYESINNFYDNLKAEFDKVDIFYSNAGIMYVPFSITKEGHESTLGTNYFGSSYLTLKMLDLMKDVDNSRIIQISSIAMYFIKEMRYEGLEDETIYSPWTWYNYSNLYRTMFSFELDRKINKLETDVAVVHPGVTRSRLYRRSKPSLGYRIIDKFKTNVSTGVAPVIEASTTSSLKKERVYAPRIIHQYGKPSTYKANKLAYNLQERETLWNYTLDKIGMKDIL